MKGNIVSQFSFKRTIKITNSFKEKKNFFLHELFKQYKNNKL